MEGLKPITLPPEICRGCQNRFTDRCLEECAPAGDLRLFEPKDIAFTDLPAFPNDEEWIRITHSKKMAIVRQHIESMHRAIKQIVNLTGVDIDDRASQIVTGFRNRRNITHIRPAGVQPDKTGQVTGSENIGAQDSDSGIGPDEVYRARQSE